MHSYWAQYDKVEIDSMHGIEPEDNEDLNENEFCEKFYIEDFEDSLDDLDRLGMSWRDFM